MARRSWSPGRGLSDPRTGPFTFEDCASCVTRILDGIGAEPVEVNALIDEFLAD
nr:hypothetical protein [Kibdelosporangium sp. MJ126-NF4]